MIFSRRDYNMVIIMIVVLIGGLTYLLAEPMISQWRQAQIAWERLDQNRAVAERVLQSRADAEQSLGTLRSTLPSYRKDEAVGADVLAQRQQHLGERVRVACVCACASRTCAWRDVRVNIQSTPPKHPLHLL